MGISQKLYEEMTGGKALQYRCKCGEEFPSHETWFHRHTMGTGWCPNEILNTTQKVVEEKTDMVNHPPHYNQGRFEVIDVIEDNLKEGFEAYLVGNILKYMMRYKHKNGIQDLEKAEVYLKKLIQTKKGEENGNETK